MKRIKKYIKRIISPVGYQIYLLIYLFYKEKKQFSKNVKKINYILSLNSTINLELGSFEKREGWLTVDLFQGADIVCDISKRLPFPENAIDRIYCSHLLEHFNHKDLIDLLYEVKRILKPRGVFLIVVPDASIYINAYYLGKDFSSFIGKNNPFFHSHSPISCINYIAYLNGEHKYMFDKDELISILSFVGFKNPGRRDFDYALDLLVRQKESIYAIAYK